MSRPVRQIAEYRARVLHPFSQQRTRQHQLIGCYSHRARVTACSARKLPGAANVGETDRGALLEEPYDLRRAIGKKACLSLLREGEHYGSPRAVRWFQQEDRQGDSRFHLETDRLQQKLRDRP
jgi:hypothetical protein